MGSEPEGMIQQSVLMMASAMDVTIGSEGGRCQAA